MVKEAEKLVQEIVGSRGDLKFLWLNLSDAALEYFLSLVFEENSPDPKFVLKIASGELALRSLASEHRSLVFLERVVTEDRKETIPQILHFERGNDTAWMLLKAIPGRPLKNEEKGPSGSNVRMRMEQISGWLGDFYSETGVEGRLFDEAVYSGYVEKPVNAFRRLFHPSGEQNDVLEAVCRFFRKIRGTSFPFLYRHGDLATSNILVDDGEFMGIIDWEIPLRRWFPLFDHFYLCASLRYCYYSMEGDGSQFESFRKTYFERNDFSHRVSSFLTRWANELCLPARSLFYLFALSVLTVAIWKMGAFLTRAGWGRNVPSTDRLAGECRIDDPFCTLEEQQCLNFRFLAENQARFILKD